MSIRRRQEQLIKSPMTWNQTIGCADTFKVLRELNVDDACAFDNKIQGDEINRYELSRIDCNQFLEV